MTDYGRAAYTAKVLVLALLFLAPLSLSAQEPVRWMPVAGTDSAWFDSWTITEVAPEVHRAWIRHAIGRNTETFRVELDCHARRWRMAPLKNSRTAPWVEAPPESYIEDDLNSVCLFVTIQSKHRRDSLFPEAPQRRRETPEHEAAEWTVPVEQGA